MANPANRPITTDEIVGARVRRAPRYGVFLVVGAGIGIIVAMILTFAFDGNSAPSEATNVVYSKEQVFGFLTLVCVSVGVLLGGIVALVLDRTVGRRTRAVTVDHETVHVDDREPEPIVLSQVDPPTSLGASNAASPSTTPPDAPRP